MLRDGAPACYRNAFGNALGNSIVEHYRTEERRAGITRDVEREIAEEAQRLAGIGQQNGAIGYAPGVGTGARIDPLGLAIPEYSPATQRPSTVTPETAQANREVNALNGGGSVSSLAPSSGALEFVVRGGQEVSQSRFDAYSSGVPYTPEYNQFAYDTLRFAEGVTDAAAQVIFQPVATAYDLGQVAYQTGRSFVTGQRPSDINYFSAVGQAALGGASTSDIIVEGLKSAIFTPIRLGEAALRGDSYGVGQEAANLGLLLYGGARGLQQTGITAKLGQYDVRSPLIPVGAGEVSSFGMKGLQSPLVRNSPASLARVSSKPEWLARIEKGNAFNSQRAGQYKYNEVYVNNPAGGYYRLDSYSPAKSEIVSRKFTQLSDVLPKTGIGYINEFVTKYPVGAKLSNVPTNVKNGLVGQRLRGQLYLEVPVQNRPVPATVLDAATQANVLIRDVNGTIY